jgi:hypothetical protein
MEIAMGSSLADTQEGDSDSLLVANSHIVDFAIFDEVTGGGQRFDIAAWQGNSGAANVVNLTMADPVARASIDHNCGAIVVSNISNRAVLKEAMGCVIKARRGAGATFNGKVFKYDVMNARLK